jgi:ubiquinone/menaquinone biosynthesis C-methylase UbiE
MPIPSFQIEQTNYISRNPIIKALLANFTNEICSLLISIGASKKRGIDAGCGEAHMLGQMHARGVLGKIVAVDVNRDYLAYAMDRYPDDHFLAADLNQMPFSDHTFDYVISTEVFEHLEDPTRAILELRRIGKKNAYLIISVPFEPFFHWGNIARGKYLNRGGYTPDHRNLWRRHEFRKFLTPFVHIEREYGFKSFPWLLNVCRFRS